jgi:transposase
MDEPPIPVSPAAESAHKIGHTSAPPPRIEVITRGERRRRWTPEQKRGIVMESLGPDLTPTEVARKHGISSGQLYTWRQQVLGRQMTLLARTQPDFAQVEMTSGARPEAPDDMPVAETAPVRAPGLIEIVLPGGMIVRVDEQVNTDALRRVLTTLGQR